MADQLRIRASDHWRDAPPQSFQHNDRFNYEDQDNSYVRTPERRQKAIDYMQEGAGINDPNHFLSQFGRPGAGAPRRNLKGDIEASYRIDEEVRFANAERVHPHDAQDRLGMVQERRDHFKTPFLRDLNQQIVEKNKRKDADRRREKQLEDSVLRGGNPFFINRKQTPPKPGKLGLPNPHVVMSPEPVLIPARSPSPPLHGTLMDGVNGNQKVYPQETPYHPPGPFGTSLPSSQPHINPETGNYLWPQEEHYQPLKPWPSYDNIFTSSIPRNEQYERKSLLVEGDNKRPHDQYSRPNFGIPQTLKFTRHLTDYPEALIRDRDEKQRKLQTTEYTPSQVERSGHQYEPVPHGDMAGNVNANEKDSMPSTKEQFKELRRQKQQYLSDLKRAADDKRRREVERYLDEHGSYIDTATLLNYGRVGKPRFVGYDAFYNRMQSDVTHPEIVGMPKAFRSYDPMIKDAYATDLERQVVDRERRRQLDQQSDQQRAKQHYSTEQAIWVDKWPYSRAGGLSPQPASFKQSFYTPPSVPSIKFKGAPTNNANVVMRG